jgi:hypothetical protein
MNAVFEEPEDPTNRSFFSEIISSISDVKFSHNGRYMVTRDYLSVKVWDLQPAAIFILFLPRVGTLCRIFYER